MSWTAFTTVAPAGDAASIAAQADVGLKTLVAHPWMQGIGEGAGHYRYLSFPNAAQALSAELLGETQAVFGLAVAAANVKDFAAQIQALTAVFPIKQFDQARIRAEQLTTLETDKFKLPDAPSLLSGGSMSLTSLPRMAEIQKAAIMQQAQAAAIDFESSDPLANLQAYQVVKAAADLLIASALDDVKALFGGGTGWQFYAESDAAAAIKNGPGHDYTLTAMMLFIGSPEQLALLREIAP